MPSRAGVKLRPTAEREKLYRRSLALRKQGLSYNKIIERIAEESGMRLRKSHLSGWLNGKHEPFGYVRPFAPMACPELAYLIGVKWGDASTNTNRNHQHMIKLRVKDQDFAEEFSRCLSVVLKRTPPKVKWNSRKSEWQTQCSSVLLQGFLLDMNLHGPVIRHCIVCEGAFLRGFYDSEGSMSGRDLKVFNGDLKKLDTIVRVLASLGIATTGPHLKRKRGGTVVIKGKIWRVNKNQYYVYVRADSLHKFAETVGFVIGRKQESLRAAVGYKASLANRAQNEHVP